MLNIPYKRLFKLFSTVPVLYCHYSVFVGILTLLLVGQVELDLACLGFEALQIFP